MYNVTRVVHFDAAAGDEDRVAYTKSLRVVAEGLGTLARVVAPTLPGVINGGDVLVHLRFPSEVDAERRIAHLDTALAASDVARVDGVEYCASAAQSREGTARGVYRALLLRVDPDTPAEVIADFERDLLAMPRYIPAMASWRLSRVARSVGSTAWSHVWEQEFTDHAALAGPYLDHPVHWSVVDRWFDPECPEVIVRDRVCHTFCAVEEPIIT